MKQKFFLTLSAGILLAGCANDEIINSSKLENLNADRRISFVQKIGNMTRGTQQAQTAGHYEFGVFATKGATQADYVAATNGVMGNYLVAYTDGTSSDINAWYKDVKENASTWGKDGNSDVTDVATGVSSWFYEGITSSNHATYTTPGVDQILKYWDQSAANHYFYAYMPYTGNTSAKTDHNADQVAFSWDNTYGAKFVYTNLSSFYTTPVSGKQVGAAAAKTGSPNKTYNDTEIINDNEALYAYTDVPKAKYGEDVPLEFKHINAKVNIAFYEVISGYKVQIIDVVPTGVTGPSGTLTAAPGVQFSPSTDNQSRQPMTKVQTTNLPTYYENANVTVSHVDGTAAISVTGTGVKKNLVFAQPAGDIATASPGTQSSTTLYVLPNYKGSEYITAADGSNYEDYASAGTHETATKVADKTGYTLHVSYKIIPDDGTASTTVYDARVHVDAQYCKWEAGKAYTYIFKITSLSNGTTDPTKVDPAVGGTTPWIDPEDPRVPDDPALVPIVFDGVMVTEYDDAGDVEGNDHVITDITSWASFGSTYRVSPAALAKADVTAMLGSTYHVVSPTTAGIVTPTNCSFNSVTRTFTIGDGTNNVTWPATVQVATITAPTYAPKYNGSAISVDVPTGPTSWYDYSLYVWEQDACSAATKYSATPTGEVVYKKKTVVTKMTKTDDTDPKYKKEVYDASGTVTSTTWYNEEACTSAWTADSDHTKDAGATTTYSEGVITYDTPTVTAGATTATKAYLLVQ